MVRRSKGPKTRARKKLRQRPSVRPTITKFLQEFSLGQSVALEPEPSSHKGMPFHKFKGSIGKVVAKRGRAYVVEIRIGNSIKQVISRPEHLKVI
ncbi:MAG: 50S ribosomal protein L21e [Candidatus Aenigmarchaeota archaeon]|nr:50S ribosomal protein L21e [Candidatus Aenigmarchaeota archaeon]